MRAEQLLPVGAKLQFTKIRRSFALPLVPVLVLLLLSLSLSLSLFTFSCPLNSVSMLEVQTKFSPSMVICSIVESWLHVYIYDIDAFAGGRW